jgi:hypothetical protein
VADSLKERVAAVNQSSGQRTAVKGEAALWEPVIPLDEPADAAPPFPLASFPALVAEHVQAVAESVYCPIDYPAVATLASASSAIGGAFVAKVKSDFFQGAGLYCCIVGDPSAKKSPPIKHVIRPIQKEQSVRVQKIREDYGEDGADTPAVYPEGRGELFVQDVTVEKLGEMLQRQPRGLLLYKPELVGWLLSQNQYKAKGVGADRSFFLEVYDSDPITIHRKSMGGGMIFVSHPSLTMVGATQPEVVREFFERRDGLAERILWTFPALLPPRGERWYETPPRLSQSWDWAIENLRNRPMQPADDTHKRPRAHQMPLSAKGREAWEVFTDRLAAAQADPDFPPWMRSAYGKFEGTAARLALVLQLLDAACDGESAGECEITDRWVNAAAEMCFYFGAHARRVQQACGSDPRLDGAKRIMLWIKDGKHKSFKRADLWQSLRRNPLFRRSEDLSAPLVLLITHNAIRARKGDAEATRTSVYDVNEAIVKEMEKD